MSKINLYSAGSAKADKLDLPKTFDGPINLVLVAQAVHVYRDRSHRGNSKVQTRGEVSLTTAKWFRQKGTGRARHGSQAAPIFVGGGVAHGPKGVKRILNLPKKMKKKALESAFAMKLKEGKIIGASELGKIKKTKEVQTLIDNVHSGEKSGKNRRVTLAVSDKNKEVFAFAKNIEGLKLERYSDLNAYKVYLGGKIILDADIFAKEKPEAKKVKKVAKKTK